MNRRKGIIAALAGIAGLLAPKTKGQDATAFLVASDPLPATIQLDLTNNGHSPAIIVILNDRRVEISAVEVMDALEAKPK